MKTKLFISFAVCVAASVLMSSCSQEEIDENGAITNGQLTAFSGGIVTEAPMEREQIGTPEISTAVPGSMIRTSMGRDSIGGVGTFFWEPNDEIYVEDDNHNLCKGQSTITGTVARTTFYASGSYTTKSQYDVYYCGTNSGAGAKKVVIAGSQTQAAFNNTKHFGAVGDCGVAKAVKDTAPGQSGYKFDLEHKASYLCFLPYIASQEQRGSYKLKSIEITSTNNIAGTYDLTQTGLSTTGTNESKTITLHVSTDPNGLLLANQTAEAPHIDNSLYVVMAPGTHSLEVTYTVVDCMHNNKEKAITKRYKSHTFAANKIYDIPINLVVSVDSSHNYYMWDAAQNYWSGHEWDSANPWQPTVNDSSNVNYPKSNTDPRWYNEDTTLGFEAYVNPLFNQLPNANELAWYVLKGDAHWDNTTQWEAFGTTHTGGIWLKKLSVIAQENGKEPAALKQADPKGKDLRASSDNYYISPKNGKPADSEIGNYFFLPALGYYLNGQLYVLGSSGSFWSSSADPTNSEFAYFLDFTSGSVAVEGVFRDNGCVAQPFE